jgi:alkyl hydroperoxide reductase subunit AhpF
MADYAVAIVGGGPAGLVAARYALHAQIPVALVAPGLGGKVNYRFALRGMPPVDTVWGAGVVREFEEYVGENLRDFIQQETTRIERLADGRFRIRLADGASLDARTVILTTGASPQRLYVPGEREFTMNGVSYSAISHAPFFRERDVAVVGGGERALVATLELATLARQVYLIAANPQAMAELPAGRRVLKHPKVSVFRHWEVQQIVGDGFVEGINLVGANGETRFLAVEGVFVQFSLMPNIEMVRGLVELDHNGHVIVNELCETSVPGFFAAGDVSSVHAEQVMVALGEGAKAALSAWQYLATNNFL